MGFHSHDKCLLPINWCLNQDNLLLATITWFTETAVNWISKEECLLYSWEHNFSNKALWWLISTVNLMTRISWERSRSEHAWGWGVGLILIRLIMWKDPPTVGGTIPWVWFLNCLRVEKVIRAASTHVIYHLSALTVDLTSFFKVPSWLHQNDDLGTWNWVSN